MLNQARQRAAFVWILFELQAHVLSKGFPVLCQNERIRNEMLDSARTGRG